MGVAAFPTEFPTDAARKIGQAILTKTFSAALVEPIYDLVGFGLYQLFGTSAPFPNPMPGPGPLPKTFAAGLPCGDDEIERVAHMLNAACDRHAAAAGTHVFNVPALSALPWGTVLNVLFTILQGLLLAAQPKPVDPAQQ